jgi:hypothetical protein
MAVSAHIHNALILSKHDTTTYMNCIKTKSPTLTRPDPNLGFIGESKEMNVLVSATTKTVLTSYIACTIQYKSMTYVMLCYVMLAEVICERLDGT